MQTDLITCTYARNTHCWEEMAFFIFYFIFYFLFYFLFFILFFIFLFFTPLPGMHIHIYLESATRLYMIYISKHYYNTSNISLARLSYTLPTYN